MFEDLVGWWLIIELDDGEFVSGWLRDGMGNTLIVETAPNVRHGVSEREIARFDAYRERPEQ